MFLHSAVSSTLDCSKPPILHPLADVLIPAPTRLLLEAFSEAAITREYYSLTFPPLSIARYSFIQPSELGRHGENENTQASKRQQREDSNPGSLDCESGILPLSYHETRKGTRIIYLLPRQRAGPLDSTHNVLSFLRCVPCVEVRFVQPKPHFEQSVAAVVKHRPVGKT